MANVFEYSKLHFHYIQNIDGSIEMPNIYLLDRALHKIGQLESVDELNIDVHFKEANSCTFKTYKYIDGNEAVLWDKIKDISIILIEGFGCFEISVPLTDGETIVKTVEGKSLQYVELGQANCTLSINTLEESGDLNLHNNVGTVFFNPSKPELSLLHRILSYMPTYSIGHVDDSLRNMQRQLECTDSTIYDFLMGDVSETFGCIFLFDPYERVINAYDLNDHCLECNSHHIIDGVCQSCKSTNVEKGYGLDTTTYVDTENLAEEIQLTGDKDSVKNCFKIKGGDDTVTQLIGQRLIGGSNYIWSFSEEMMNAFSYELREKYKEYVKLCDSYQNSYNSYWDISNECTNKINYWTHSKMPVLGETDDTTPESVWMNIVSEITYACISSKNTTLTTLSNNILNYAKLCIPSGYDIKFQTDGNGENMVSCVKSGNIITQWTGYLYLYIKNDKDDTGKDRYSYTSSAWTLPVKAGYDSTPTNNVFSNDYFLFLKQQLDKRLKKMEIVDEAKHDIDYTDGVSNHLSDSNYYKNYFREYGTERLRSFRDAYNQCSIIMHDLNNNLTDKNTVYLYKVNSSGTLSNHTIYEELIGKYIDFVLYIDSVILEYESIIQDYTEKQNKALDEIQSIRDICNIQNYLGEDLYYELMTFRREDVYENSNYTSEVVDDTTLMKNVEELITCAKEEINKAKEIHYSSTVSMGSLLANRDYNEYYNKFAVGNYVRLRIDEILVKIRLVGIKFNFTQVEDMDVSFSDALVVNTNLNDVQTIIKSANSMATSFAATKNQSEKNDKGLNDFHSMFSKGLSEIDKLIKDAHSQMIEIDSSGLLGRKWDEDEQSYDPCQIRIINNCIAFTKDNWQSICSAFGKIYWNNDWHYGVIAEYLIGKMIIGNSLEIINDSGTYKINDDGFLIKNGNNSIELNANTLSMSIIQNGAKKFYYSPTTGLEIDGSGKFSGRVDVGTGASSIILDPTNPSMVIWSNGSKVFDFNSNNDNRLKFSGEVFVGNSNSYIQLDPTNPSMQIVSHGNVLFDFNSDGNEKLFVKTEGNFVGGLTVGEESPTTKYIKLSPDNPSMFIYDGEKKVFDYNSDNMNKLTIDTENFKLIDDTVTVSNGLIGGWKILSNSIQSETGQLKLNATGEIFSHSDKFSATLSQGKFVFGKYNENGAINTKEGYFDISQLGIFGQSEAGSNHTSRPYILQVDTVYDIVKITGCSENPALHVKNYGNGTCLYIENTQSGSGNKAFQAKIFTGDNTTRYNISMFGEAATKHRCVLRCDSGDDTGVGDWKAGSGALGTVNYPWEDLYVTNDVHVSDLKTKDVISNISKEKSLKFINSLEPINYTFKSSNAKRIHMGFGAQTVSKNAKELDMGDLALYEAAVINDDGTESYYDDSVDDSKLSWGLKYTEFIAPMVASIQALSEKIEYLEKELEEYKNGYAN